MQVPSPLRGEGKGEGGFPEVSERVIASHGPRLGDGVIDGRNVLEPLPLPWRERAGVRGS